MLHHKIYIMKKFLLMTLVSAIGLASQAQTASVPVSTAPAPKETIDAATMLQQMKAKIAPQMVEKIGLSTEKAEKVIEILFEMRQAAGALQNLSEDDRSKKLAELKATKDRKFSELLTEEQITAVKSFYQEMGKNQQKN